MREMLGITGKEYFGLMRGWIQKLPINPCIDMIWINPGSDFMKWSVHAPNHEIPAGASVHFKINGLDEKTDWMPHKMRVNVPIDIAGRAGKYFYVRYEGYLIRVRQTSTRTEGNRFKPVKKPIKRPFAAYKKRNVTLKEIGYESYREYLKSGEWKELRKRVLDRDNHRCRVCMKPANQAHHRHYRMNVLSGACIDGLMSLCGRCHQFIEMDRDGKKVPFRLVRKRIYILLRVLRKSGELKHDEPKVSPLWIAPQPKRAKKQKV